MIITGRSLHEDALPLRQSAYRILNDIFFRCRCLEEACAAEPRFAKLTPRDRVQARQIVVTVMKRARQIDAVVQDLLQEKIALLKPPQLVNILRIGIAQLAFLGVPAQTVIDNTLALADAERILRQKQLVSAVLRRIAREGFTHPDPRTAGRLNTPDWLWTQLMRDYGVENALDICAANMLPATIDFSVRADAEKWSKLLAAEILPTGSLRKPADGFASDISSFLPSAWWLQDAADALPAKLFGDLRGKTVADLCAAPGNKTAQLAAQGARVIAVDRAAHRVAALQENMSRLGLEAETHVADAAQWQPQEKIDAVLLDAPCTNTGIIRHQPDALHGVTEKDQDKFIAEQRSLLANAAKMLAPGGMLMYCVSSLQKAECDDQVEWILAQNARLKPLPIIEKDCPGIYALITPRGTLRTVPTHWDKRGGMDGVYAARLLKQ
jgi:16S rRNA (cytosine967-C5)-methyltransferase